MTHPGATPSDKHKVVIIGSGFGGLNAAKKLKRADVDIKLIAKTTHHLFQPLLYQVATGIISEGEIAPPTRVVLRDQRNCQVLLGEVTHIDLKNQTVDSILLGHTYRTPYDTLIVAAGAGQSYFGNDHLLKGAFRHIDSTKARVILLDAAPAVLPPMGEKLGKKAAARLEKLGVEIQLGAMVTDVDRNGISVKRGDGTIDRIECATKVWSAGVSASPLGKQIADQSGAEVDRAGRVKVLPDLTVPGHPNVFVVGDMAAMEGVPGMAQGAIQGARYAAKLVKAELKGADPAAREPFEYFDKGSMATVSRYSAVAKVGPIEFAGFIAWLAWLFLHLIYLVGFKARLTTALSWISTFIGSHRGQLTITEQQAYARTRIEQLEEIAAAVEDEKATA